MKSQVFAALLFATWNSPKYVDYLSHATPNFLPRKHLKWRANSLANVALKLELADRIKAKLVNACYYCFDVVVAVVAVVAVVVIGYSADDIAVVVAVATNVVADDDDDVVVVVATATYVNYIINMHRN